MSAFLEALDRELDGLRAEALRDQWRDESGHYGGMWSLLVAHNVRYRSELSWTLNVDNTGLGYGRRV